MHISSRNVSGGTTGPYLSKLYTSSTFSRDTEDHKNPSSDNVEQPLLNTC